MFSRERNATSIVCPQGIGHAAVGLQFVTRVGSQMRYYMQCRSFDMRCGFRPLSRQVWIGWPVLDLNRQRQRSRPRDRHCAICVRAGKVFQSRGGGVDTKGVRVTQRDSTGSYRAAFGAQINFIKLPPQWVAKFRAVEFRRQMWFEIEPVGFGLNAVDIPIQPHDRHAVSRQNIIAFATL